MASASPVAFGGLEDLQLQRGVWAGCVPCVFTLAPDEVTTMAEEPPHAHYLLLPRHAYLPCAAAAVIAHFKAFAPSFAQASDVWFEAEAQPLKWHQPLGVLFDLHHRAGAVSGPGAGASGGAALGAGATYDPFAETAGTRMGVGASVSDLTVAPASAQVHGRACAPRLPWPITVHFQHFPKAALLGTDGDAQVAVRYRFMNSLKQSLFLRYGRPGTAFMQGLGEADKAQLWRAVERSDLDKYLELTRALHVLPQPRLAVRVLTVTGPPRQLPLPAEHPSTANDKDAGSGGGGQKLVPLTLGDALVELVPTAFHRVVGANDVDDADDSTPTGPRVVPVEQGAVALVQGVCPPLDAPLAELCAFLSHPDGMLYVSIVQN